MLLEGLSGVLMDIIWAEVQVSQYPLIFTYLQVMEHTARPRLIERP